MFYFGKRSAFVVITFSQFSKLCYCLCFPQSKVNAGFIEKRLFIRAVKCDTNYDLRRLGRSRKISEQIAEIDDSLQKGTLFFKF